MKIIHQKLVHLDTVIGIDPDVDKNGVACLDCNTRTLEISTYTFPDLLDYLLYMKRSSEVQGKNAVVIVEAGWMNKGNWHVRRGQSVIAAAKTGQNTGRNEQVSRIIGQMCERYGLHYEFIKPLRKVWRGKDGKITHEELAYFTGIQGHTNQEGRDAALLAWEYAGFPVKVAPIGSNKLNGLLKKG